MKAVSFVMVDFSCALKLSIPLAVLSAMQEASKRGITVKGGKCLEQVAEADMIVFDKTGTVGFNGALVAGGVDRVLCRQLVPHGYTICLLLVSALKA